MVPNDRAAVELLVLQVTHESPHMGAHALAFLVSFSPSFVLCYRNGSLTVFCTAGEARDSERNHRLRSPPSPELSWGD